MIRAVVFDLGQVLASPPNLYSEPARLLGVDADAFEAAYWDGRRAYDEGGTDEAYWGPILRKLGKTPSPETVRQLARLDATLWLDLRPEAWQLLRDVREYGYTVAVLSNAPFVLDMALLDAPFVDDADYWFVSASMGITKPNRAAYDRVTEVLDLERDQIAFIDDRLPNVEAALAYGWQAHLFVDDADTRAWLVELGVLDAEGASDAG